MKKFQMFVITHKNINYKLIKNYIPIQVGRKNTNANLNYITDETGDNISEKNNNYCELTAVYWIYKNYELPEYIGICHYRRFFVKGLFSKLVDEKFVDCVFKKYDVVLPKRYVTESTVREHYINSSSGKEKDIDNLRNIIEDIYPQYTNDYDFIMNSKKASYCNMCIMRKEDYIEYCNWLFTILFELEKITDLTGYTKQEARIYGFLSEFLLNVWILHNNKKIKYNSTIFVEGKKIKDFLRKLYAPFKRK